MQQTKTYKLNLMETSDTFSPDPLNQNTQMIEDALSAETVRRTAGDTALDSRVTVLEGHKVAVGSYTGAGELQTIQLGFRPRAVIIQQVKLTGDCFLATSAGGCATMAATGFTLTTSGHPNSLGAQYSYVAIK